MEILIGFTGVPVSDFAAARTFYERFFGRPADVVAHETEVMWRLAETAWLYVVEDAERAGHALVSLSVENLYVALAELRGRGIVAPDVEDMPGAGRKVTIRDPDGNSVALIEVLDRRR
jgi:predicted enzyme related to lactoylglutathione lyase